MDRGAAGERRRVSAGRRGVGVVSRELVLSVRVRRARELGHRDRSDGTWVWPDGLAHYVAAHDVRLPARFVRHALARVGDAAAMRRVRALRWTARARLGIVDDTPWLAWGRARHACLELAGWTAPMWAEQRALAARLARRVTRDHVLAGSAGRDAELVLARADRGEVVLRLADGRVAIARLADGDTRILDGWHAWPRARAAVALR